MSLLLPVGVWLGVIVACSLVGGCLGSAAPESLTIDPRSALRPLALLASLSGYSLAMRYLFAVAVAANYAPAALRGLGATLLISLVLAAATTWALGTARQVVAGVCLGVATTLCAFGPGLPLIFWLAPIVPDLMTTVTFLPSFAGALAACRVGRRALPAHDRSGQDR